MPVLLKFGPNDINPSRLEEDLKAAGLSALNGMSYPGYDVVSSRRSTAIPVRKVVTRIIVNGSLTEIFADPNEVHLTFTRALTGTEEATLNTTLAGHVYTNLSQEQVRQDQDEVDRTELATAFNSLLKANFDSLTNAQWKELLRSTTRLLARLALRDSRGSAI